MAKQISVDRLVMPLTNRVVKLNVMEKHAGVVKLRHALIIKQRHRGCPVIFPLSNCSNLKEKKYASAADWMTD